MGKTGTAWRTAEARPRNVVPSTTPATTAHKDAGDWRPFRGDALTEPAGRTPGSTLAAKGRASRQVSSGRRDLPRLRVVKNPRTGLPEE